jgi:two-component system chemotaxis response regulator CheY
MAFAPRSIKILIADDRAIMRDLLKTILRGLPDVDATIVEASDGRQSAQQFMKHRPQITFLDIKMPVVDGLTALKDILELDSNAYVVMVSGECTAENVKSAVTAGAKAFVAKPYTAAKIANVLQPLLVG